MGMGVYTAVCSLYVYIYRGISMKCEKKIYIYKVKVWSKLKISHFFLYNLCDCFINIYITISIVFKPRWTGPSRANPI